MKYRLQTLLQIAAPPWFFSFCETFHLAAPPPNWTNTLEARTASPGGRANWKRIHPSALRNLCLLRALSSGECSLKGQKGPVEEQSFQRINLVAEAESKWGSEKCPPSLEVPWALTFPSEILCSLSLQHLRKAINEAPDFTTWLKDMLQGWWCSVGRLLAKN